jgi:hypothetical protein
MSPAKNRPEADGYVLNVVESRRALLATPSSNVLERRMFKEAVPDSNPEYCYRQPLKLVVCAHAATIATQAASRTNHLRKSSSAVSGTYR